MKWVGWDWRKKKREKTTCLFREEQALKWKGGREGGREGEREGGKGEMKEEVADDGI